MFIICKHQFFGTVSIKIMRFQFTTAIPNKKPKCQCITEPTEKGLLFMMWILSGAIYQFQNCFLSKVEAKLMLQGHFDVLQLDYSLYIGHKCGEICLYPHAIESLLEICSCLLVFAQIFNFRTKYENIGPNFPSYSRKSSHNPSFQAGIASLTCKFEQTAVQETVNSSSTGKSAETQALTI